MFPLTGKKFNAILETACRLARITQENVILGDAPHGMLAVPLMKEDPRTVRHRGEIIAAFRNRKGCPTPFGCEQEGKFHGKN